MSAGGSGCRRSCSISRTSMPVPAVCSSIQPSTEASVSITVTVLIPLAVPVSRANLAIATAIRSSSPSRTMLVPSNAPTSCSLSTRCSLVATLQCVWSSSIFACGAPDATWASALSSPGISDPSPSQYGHRASRCGPGPVISSRARTVRLIGLVRSTTPCLRSSLQIAVTIGTGSSAALLT